MRIDHYRQVLCIFHGIAFRQSQVTFYGQSVAAGIGNRVHGAHILFFDPWRYVGHLGKLVFLYVIKVVGSVCAVVAGIDQADILVLALAGGTDVIARELGFQFLTYLFFFLVEIVADHVLVSFTGYCCQPVLLFGVAEARDVVLVVHVQNLLLFAGFRIHQDQCGLVASDVGQCVDHLVVGRKDGEAGGFLEVGGQYRLERLVFRFTVQYLGVDTVYYGAGYTQLSVVVGHPSLYVARVLGQQSQFSCIQVQAVRVEYLRVTLVHADDNQ